MGFERKLKRCTPLQKNRFHCGRAEDLLLQIEPDSIDLSIWSPPYFVGKNYEAHLNFESWQLMLREAIVAHETILKPGGFLVINIADILAFPDPKMPRIQAPNLAKLRCKVTRKDVLAVKAQYPDFNRNQVAALLGCSEQTIDRRLNGNNIRGGKYKTQTRVQSVASFIVDPAYDAGLYLYDKRVWAKDPTWANSQWHSSSYRAVSEYEDLYVFWKPGETVVDRSRLNKREWAEWGSRQIWTFRSVRKNDIHEAQFPLELPLRFIKLLTGKSATILDPFMGSGTTALAALELDRDFIGIELLAKYVNLANNRVNRCRGKGKPAKFL